MASSKRSGAAAAPAVIVLDSSDDDNDTDDHNSAAAAAAKTTNDKRSAATSGRRATERGHMMTQQPKQKAATVPAPPAAYNHSKSGNSCTQNKVKGIKRIHSHEDGVVITTTNTSTNRTPTTPSVASAHPPVGRKVPFNNTAAGGTVPPPPIMRRIKPTLLSSTVSTKRPHLAGDSDDDYENDKAKDDDDIITITSPKRSPTKATTTAVSISPPKKPRTAIVDTQSPSPASTKTKSSPAAVAPPKTPITAAFAALLSACREAEPSDAMERLITRKLTRYYQSVHPEFVSSKSFSRAAMRVATDIRLQPKLVYVKLENILEELRIRHKSGAAAALAAAAAAAAAETSADDTSNTGTAADALAPTEGNATNAGNTTTTTPPATPSSSSAACATATPAAASPDADSPGTSPGNATTGNARKDQQIRRLNHALYLLKKRIARLDEAEVDLDDEDNSTYLLVERYKKRACEIYEKICDITGESKHACRSTRRPIEFNGTAYPLFNRTIQSFVNRTRTFPDLEDVRRCLEHCNKQYGFDLSREEVRRVAQDAFAKIGKLLQRRRKQDLYETVEYLTEAATTTAAAAAASTATAAASGEDEGACDGSGPAAKMVDPAKSDVQLQRKLADNDTEYRRRMHAIIDRYAAQQDQPDATKKGTAKGQPVTTTAATPTAAEEVAVEPSGSKSPDPLDETPKDNEHNDCATDNAVTICDAAATSATDDTNLVMASSSATAVSLPTSPTADGPTTSPTTEAGHDANAPCIIIDDD